MVSDKFMTGRHSGRVPVMILTDAAALDEHSYLLDDLVAGQQ